LEHQEHQHHRFKYKLKMITEKKRLNLMLHRRLIAGTTGTATVGTATAGTTGEVGVIWVVPGLVVEDVVGVEEGLHMRHESNKRS